MSLLLAILGNVRQRILNLCACLQHDESRPRVRNCILVERECMEVSSATVESESTQAPAATESESAQTSVATSPRHIDVVPEVAVASLGSDVALICRLLSGQVLSVDLRGALCMRDARGKVADTLGLLRFEQEIVALCGGELLDDSTTLCELLELQQRHGEVTIVAKELDMVWQPEDFIHLGKAVEKIIRSNGATSDYMIKYRDGSWRRHQGSPQLDALFAAVSARRRRGLGGE